MKTIIIMIVAGIMKTNKPTGNFKRILLAMAIMAGSLGSISWLNPEIKDGKVVHKRTAAKILATTTTSIASIEVAHISQKSKRHFIIMADDTARMAQLADTKKKSTIKIVVEDGNGSKKEYTSIKELPVDVCKKFLSENLNINTDLNLNLNMDTARLADVARNIRFDFNNELRVNNDKLIRLSRDIMAKLKTKKLSKTELKKWKKQSADMRKNLRKSTANLIRMYNSPEWKKRIADITKASTDFADKITKSEDWTNAQKELTIQSMKFSQDFINSAEWKAYQEELMKQVQELLKMQNESSKESGKKLE
jgi:bla regulator protein blaR1